MPEFYAAIFGAGETATGGEVDRDRPSAMVAATNIEGGGGVGAGVGASIDNGGKDGGCGGDLEIGGGVGSVGGSDGAAAAAGRAELFAGQLGEGAAVLTMSTAELGGDGIGGEASASAVPQQQQEQQRGGLALSGVGVRPEEDVSGVALQERLAGLREVFTKEQCGLVLKNATGWW